MRKLLRSIAAALALAALAVAVPPSTTGADEAMCVREGVALCGKCGDGYCNPRCGENEYTCPKDCAVTTY